MKEIKIPESVTSIGDYAFWDCSQLEKIEVDENNPRYDSRNNCNAIIDKETNTLIAGCVNTTIPESVTSIGGKAFSGCSSLSEIKIPESVTSIGSQAFRACRSLSEIKIPESVTSIEGGVFSHCPRLKEIKVDKNNKRYDSRNNCNAIIDKITNTLILGCVNTTIPESVTRIGDYAFVGCSSLSEIKIPESVTSIGNNAFGGCSSLKEIIIPKSVISIGKVAFLSCLSLSKITIQGGVTSIGNSAFECCSSLKEITIPDSVTSIGGEAFQFCTILTEITIQGSVTSIGEWAFWDCSQLEKIEVDENNPRYDSRNNCNAIIDKETNTLIAGCVKTTIPESVTSIGGKAFSGCSSLSEIKIPESVTSIGSQAFRDCRSLSEIKIPESVTSIEGGGFSHCPRLKEIKVDKNNKRYDSRNNCNAIIDKATNTLIAGCVNTTIPESVTSIGGKAFSGCSSLKEIKIPKGVTSIEESAFYYCENLTKITISEGVTSIGDYAFSGCSSLKEVTIPESVTSVGEGAFYGCALEEIKFEIKGKGALPIPFNGEKITQNFLENCRQVLRWKEEKKVKFIPPNYTLATFPSKEMDKYFLSKNNQRWGRLVKTLGFDTLNEQEKNNSLSDLMKIYYAIGGFSENQGQSEKAYEYILNYVAKIKDNLNATPSEVGEEIHRRFSRLNIDKPFNLEFAKFFMRYYKDNPDFMCLKIEVLDERDYLCDAYNRFEEIQRNNPNRVVNGNTERDLLTPELVVKQCAFEKYENVNKGNEKLAEYVGRYGYSQSQFEHIQEKYEIAKKGKDSYVIVADKSDEKDPVRYRFLEKDDPLGAVLGDITNCCQHIGGAASSCVDDGYTNPNSGFLVFEDDKLDKNGNPTGEKRVIGQAYIWYDPKTKTVCYDNIEIPTKVLEEMEKGDFSGKGLTTKKIIDSVKKSAVGLMKKMNEKGVIVERVTTGAGYNDLQSDLAKIFKGESNPKSKNRAFGVYTDAENKQYIIATYDEVTKMYRDSIVENIAKAENILDGATAQLTDENRQRRNRT